MVWQEYCVGSLRLPGLLCGALLCYMNSKRSVNKPLLWDNSQTVSRSTVVFSVLLVVVSGELFSLSNVGVSFWTQLCLLLVSKTVAAIAEKHIRDTSSRLYNVSVAIRMFVLTFTA